MKTLNNFATINAETHQNSVVIYLESSFKKAHMILKLGFIVTIIISTKGKRKIHGMKKKKKKEVK